MKLPTSQDRGIIVFWLAPSLGYAPRMAASFGLIAVGLVAQLAAGTFFPGALALLAGNLLLLVKGYDNRVDFKKFEADAHWERVGIEKLEQLKTLDEKIRRWDRSVLDVSNPLGLVAFVLVAGAIAAGVFLGTGVTRLLALDAIVLLLPHWVTGIRTILRQPTLLVRIEMIESVLQGAKGRLEDHDVSVMMLLTGGDTQIPEDVKFRIDFADRHKDFLGLYGQVVINEVQGTSHPYFYVVLVARQGFGLQEAYHRYDAPKKVTKEFKRQGEVEVMVVRQRTTKTSGYATKPQAAQRIFFEGLNVAERVAAGVAV